MTGIISHLISNKPGYNKSIIFNVDLKNAQHESCEVSFIWGKMRTAAWETAPQIVLRNCSKEAKGKVSIYVILVMGKYMQSSKHIFFQISASHEKQSSP